MFGLLRLVVFVQCHQRHAQAEMREQLRGMARIFGSDRIRVPERFQRPGRKIAEIADGRGDDVKAARCCG